MAYDPDSILDSVKQMLGIDSDYTPFDPEITLHINAVLSDLSQLGIGPVDGFFIQDRSAKWSDFLTNNALLNSAKSYTFLRVKMLFDPPTSGFVITAMTEQIKQWEWRLNVTRETTDWVDPNPAPLPPINPEEDFLLIDGGGA